MNKEELEKYKIRDYYMIPVEVVDNVFYLFEQQCKKQKEINKKAIEYIKRKDICIDIRKTDGSLECVSTNELLEILEEKGD